MAGEPNVSGVLSDTNNLTAAVGISQICSVLPITCVASNILITIATTRSVPNVTFNIKFV